MANSGPVSILTALAGGLLAAAALAQQAAPTPAPPASAPPAPASPAAPSSPEGHSNWFFPKSTPQEVLEAPEAKARLEQFLKEYYKVHRIPRSEWRGWERYPDGTAKFLFGADIMEVVKEDEEAFYVRQLNLEDERASGRQVWNAMVDQIVGRAAWRDYYAEMAWIPAETFVPPPFTDTLRFEDFSRGLPDRGLWQLDVARADFNGDGRLDLALPPPRKGDGMPHIFLQTKDGWAEWRPLKWPQEAKLDYGGIAVEDFDRDGHLDLALACHFARAYVLYGNGNGDFSRYAALPDTPTSYRSIAVADFTGDDLPDLAMLTEIDFDQNVGQQKKRDLVSVFVNPGKGGTWKQIDASSGIENLMGDDIEAVDIDGDGRKDLAIAAMKASMSLFFLNRAGGTKWIPVTSKAFPYMSYVPTVAVLPGGKKQPDSVVLGVLQRENPQMGPKRNANAIVTITPRRPLSKDFNDPANWDLRVVNAREKLYDAYQSVATGDLNGDGRADLVAGRQTGVIEVYLQQQDGSFIEEKAPELSLGDAVGRVFALDLVDLDADGRDDLIVVAGPDEGAISGQVRAFLSRTVAPAKAARP